MAHTGSGLCICVLALGWMAVVGWVQAWLFSRVAALTITDSCSSHGLRLFCILHTDMITVLFHTLSHGMMHTDNGGLGFVVQYCSVEPCMHAYEGRLAVGRLCMHLIMQEYCSWQLEWGFRTGCFCICCPMQFCMRQD